MALVRTPDMRGDVAQRDFAVFVRTNPIAVVAHNKRRAAATPSALHNDLARVGVDRVLHELGHRLARIALAAREPADQIERIGGLKPDARRTTLRSNRHETLVAHASDEHTRVPDCRSFRLLVAAMLRT